MPVSMPTKVFRGLEEVVFHANSINTIGTFDGLHRGHQTILAEVRREAQERDAVSTVVTFSPHPQLVLRRQDRPPVKVLTTDAEKVALLEAAGIDRVVVIPFTLEFSRTASQDFVREVLFRRIGMSGVVLGHDHGFGKNREGDFALMQRLGEDFGFTVRELPPFDIDGVVLSSTRVRDVLSQGDVKMAAKLLGRPYRFSARVIQGVGRGRQIGFPTANLLPELPDKLIPARGVYAVRVHRGAQTLGGMMNIGLRPTFDATVETIEVHVFAFDDNLYGETLSIEFVDRLRDEQRFAGADDLVMQLRRDREQALQRLAAARATV